MRNAENRTLRGLILAVTGSVVCEVLGWARGASLLFTVTFPLTMLLWLLSVRRTLVREDMLMLLAAAMAAVAVILNGFAARYIHPAVLKKAVMFGMTLLFFRAADRLRPDKTTERFWKAVGSGLSLFLAAAGIFQEDGAFLTLNFSNPNLAGLFLVCLYMLQLCCLFEPGRWWKKLLHGILGLWMGYLVLRTHSRNCILVMAAFTALWILLLFYRGPLRIGKVMAMLIALLPGLFAVFYLLLVQTDTVQRLAAFLTGEGKPLDTRLEIWKSAAGAIAASPLTGDCFGLVERTGTAQMHNTHLEIAGAYGLPALAVVVWLLRCLLYQRGECSSGKAGFCARMAFGCGIALGMGEAALFSGGLGIYVYMGLFLLMSHERRECDEGQGVTKQ